VISPSGRARALLSSALIGVLAATAVVSLSGAALAEEAAMPPAATVTETVVETPVVTATPLPSEDQDAPAVIVDDSEVGDTAPDTGPDAPEVADTAGAVPAPASTHILEIPVPVITSPPVGTVSLDSVFTVSGTVEASALDLSVTVVADSDVPSFLGFCSVSIPADETAWSCDLDLGTFEGDVVLTASAREDFAESLFGDDSDPIDMTIDSGAESLFTNYLNFSNTFSSQTFLFEGTGPANGNVLVKSYYYPYVPSSAGEQTVDVCTAQISAGGVWQCTGGPLPNGGASYYDYAYFEIFTYDYFGVQVNVNGDDEIGGDVVPAPPTLDYTLTPAGAQVAATGGDGALIAVELYATEDNGEGYNFSLEEQCGDTVGEGGGFGVESAGFVPASITISCAFTGLQPGVWNIYYAQEIDGVESNWTDDYILIPETPTMSGAGVNADRTVRFSGTGTPGYRAQVLRGVSTTPLCTATVLGNGEWLCTATPPAGGAQFSAVQQSVGFEPVGGVPYADAYDGVSARSAARTVVVPAAPAPAAPPVTQLPPPPQQAPPTPGTVQVTGLPSNAPVGAEFDVVGTTECIEPLVCDVDVDIFSTPQRLGSTVTDPEGAFALRVAVPQDFEPGDHTIVVTVTPRGGIPFTVSQPIVVERAVVEPASVDDSPAVDETEVGSGADSGSGVGGDASGGDRQSPAAPSALTDAIPTLVEIFRNPIVTITAGGLALAILLLVAFPTELLNSTLSANTRRFGRGFAALERGVDRVTDWFAAVTRTRAAAAAVLIVITSVIFGFMDPSFGFDAVSVRLTLALAIGLFFVTYVSSWISGAIIWRVWRFETSIGLQPAALVFALIGVVIARLLEFSPGFLIGLVIGLEIVTRVGAPHRVRAVLTQLGVMVGISVLAWVGYSILSATTMGDRDWVTALAIDTFAAATAEGLTAAAVAILPLGFLEGREIFQRSKALWIGAFLVTATLFALLVLPTEDGIDDISNVGTWLVVLVAFAVVTLSLWAVLHYTNPDRHTSDEDEGARETEAAER